MVKRGTGDTEYAAAGRRYYQDPMLFAHEDHDAPDDYIPDIRD